MTPGDQRFNKASSFDRVFRMVLIMTWFQVGYRKASLPFRWSCPPGTLNRALRRVVPDPTKLNAPLRVVWRQYLGLLTHKQQGLWQEKLKAQETWWKAWESAGHHAARIHNPEFKSIYIETQRFMRASRRNR